MDREQIEAYLEGENTDIKNEAVKSNLIIEDKFKNFLNDLSGDARLTDSEVEVQLRSTMPKLIIHVETMTENISLPLIRDSLKPDIDNFFGIDTRVGGSGHLRLSSKGDNWFKIVINLKY